MSVPLRTAYHSASYSVSSLSSAGSDASDAPGSSAPTTPLNWLKDGETRAKRDQWGVTVDNDDGISQASESIYGDDDDEGYQTDDGVKDDAASVASAATYASTAPSESARRLQYADEYSNLALPLRDSGQQTQRPRHPRPMASSPSDFAYYFPSTRLLHIAHQDDCVDGNMNLTVQTEGWASASEANSAQNEAPIAVPLTLYHLRMHNLKKREFSLRRYCRESGREVCHSTRKYTRPAMAAAAKDRRRPGSISGSGSGSGLLPARIGSLLASLRLGAVDSKSGTGRRKSTVSSLQSLKRVDSGYVSLASPIKGVGGAGTGSASQGARAGFFDRLSQEEDLQVDTTATAAAAAAATTDTSDTADTAKTDEFLHRLDGAICEMDEYEHEEMSMPATPMAANLPLPPSTTKLHFSNYLHLDLRRRGGRGGRRYEFEHWGQTYSWHRRAARAAHRDGGQEHKGKGKDAAASRGIELHLRTRVGSGSAATEREIAHLVPEAALALHGLGSRDSDTGACVSGGDSVHDPSFWVPPSAMWIGDAAELGRAPGGGAELADVIVATGLLALVDDAIRRRWDRGRSGGLLARMAPAWAR